MINKFICACNNGVADSSFVPQIHQPPHVSTRSACSDKTLSSILGWFILPVNGFLFILFFRNPRDLRTRWNFRISPDCWKDSARQLQADLRSWERLSFQSTGSWHMFLNYKMLESVRLKQLAGFTPQSWFSQISYRFPSKVVQRFLQILIINFFCPSKALLTQPKDKRKITLLVIFFLLTEMDSLFVSGKNFSCFFPLRLGTIYFINVRCLFAECSMFSWKTPQSPQKTAPSLDGDLNTARLEY